MPNLSPTLYVTRASYARMIFARHPEQGTAGFVVNGDAHGTR